MKCLRVPTPESQGDRQPTRPAAELYTVPLLNTVYCERLLTGNKNLGFGVFHGLSLNLTGWSRADTRARVTAHKVAWGRAWGFILPIPSRQQDAGLHGRGGVEDLVGWGLGQEGLF